MTNNDGIEVLQVANGFIVIPRYSHGRDSMVIDHRETYVFQTFAELVAWLPSHFTHRDKNLRWDSMEKQR